MTTKLDPTLASEAEAVIVDLIGWLYGDAPAPRHLPRCAMPHQKHDPAVSGDPDDCPWCIIGEIRSRLGHASGVKG